MIAEIINLAEYRRAKQAEQVRRVVDNYFAEYSKAMAWWLCGSPVS